MGYAGCERRAERWQCRIKVMQVCGYYITTKVTVVVDRISLDFIATVGKFLPPLSFSPLFSAPAPV